MSAVAKRAVAKRYRKKGLDETARRMVEFLEQRWIEGATVLEVGGGVGEIQIELLKRGAARAVNVELSPAYEQEATSLLRAAGLEERAERRLYDIAVSGGCGGGRRRRVAPGGLLLPGL